MIQSPPSPVMAPSTENPSGLTHSHPVHWSTVANLQQAIIRLADIHLLRPSGPIPVPSPKVVATMQRLVEIINLLRSTAPATAVDRDLPTTLLDPETIFPYVSEEAYEVFDALQAVSANQMETIKPVDATTAMLSSPPLIPIATLIPYLLWSLACSSYRVMQLLEGVNVRQHQPGQPSTAGMLRLVALLEITTPIATECFDLVTGDFPMTLLSHGAVLEADEKVLPIPQTAPGINQNHPVRQQLQTLQQQIQALSPVMQACFTGTPIDILQPGQTWQAGTMHLRLEFEFIPADGAIAPAFHIQSELVEAEFLEEELRAPLIPTSNTAPRGAVHASPVTHVAVVECPSLLNAATLVRLTDQPTLDHFAAATLQQAYGKAIAHLQSEGNKTNTDHQLRQIVNQADAISRQVPVLMESGFNTLLPELLIDELIPKLRWQITRSSNEVMQLFGGVEASVLQPGLNWEQGTLRLLALLHIRSTNLDCAIDLASGQLRTTGVSQLHPLSICQHNGFPTPAIAADVGWCCQYPIQVDAFLATLQRRLHTIPEIGLLLDGTDIEWLEAEQDWQVGTLHLGFALEFTAVV